MDKAEELKEPLDRFPYARDPRSQPIQANIKNGLYVFVQDLDGVVYVLPDGAHFHPKVLGGCSPALYAGDLSIENGVIHSLTNVSGTFQFNDPAGLLAVADSLISIGLQLKPDAIYFFPTDGSRPYTIRQS